MSQRTLGIILAGGKSSRLYPATFATTKQVLPIYDKPLIYYPLSTLMLANIRDYVLITTPEEQNVFKALLWDAKEKMGIDITYLTQDQPRGIADAFNIVSDSLDVNLDNFSRFALILGDNIFYGGGLTELLTEACNSASTTIIATKVKDPERFGVVQLGDLGQIIDIEEKPKVPKSNLAITGLYFFNSSVFSRASTLTPSKRGELEITDLINTYISNPMVDCITMPRGSIWFDTGTPDSLLEASNLIQMIQKHQGFMVGNPHEIAYNRGWILRESLRETALLCEKSLYGQYLLDLLER